MKIIRSFGHVAGGALLIAGTTIGVGMLALPVATGSSGFVPAAISYVLCWLFMVCTSLLLLEVCLWMPPDTSFISIANRLLGSFGKNVFWIAYLFLFITVMVAHVVGGGAIFYELTKETLSQKFSILLYAAAAVPVVYLGIHSVDRLNLFLISGVVVYYVAFIFVSWTQVNPVLLKYADWTKAWIAFPILFTAFTFQVIIPTLLTYMERNSSKIRKAIWIGSSIPLAVYLVWEALILGIIPPNDLAEAASRGQNALDPLLKAVNNPIIISIGKGFAFFALTTSFIPLALSFFDFLADGFKLKKKGLKKIGLILAVFGIPTMVALIYPNIFLKALGYAGGISCAFLFGLMPPILAWIGRYVKHYSGQQQLRGGKTMLGFLMMCSLLILIFEIAEQIFL